MDMRILADQNIPFAREAFAALGEVELMDGRRVTAPDVAGCDLLLVRSVTKINAGLLEGSRVKFVATATIGAEHVDEAYLARRGIGFSNAPGSNARSVSEYVASALCHLAVRQGFTLAGRTLGVVGVGNIGSQVAAWAEALGMRVLPCDPPLARQSGGRKYRPFEELFAADILTFHVPLTHEGPDATYHMLDADVLARIRPETILLNTCRGAVFDNAALLAAAAHRLVLDCWENEPRCAIGLLERTALATAHIAGYSLEGKVKGTQMVQHAAVEFLGQGEPWDPAPHMPEPYTPRLQLTRAPDETDEQLLHRALSAVYDVAHDDALFREAASAEADARARAFDALRNGYRIRREFAATRVALDESTAKLRPQLAALGFSLDTAPPDAER